MKNIVAAIVGRPNVGKSTLFNKLIGQRVSIVDDTPGVTRDRIYGVCEWRGKKISLIDTGGIEFGKHLDAISENMRKQAEIATHTADIIFFVVDIKSGLTTADEEVATILKKSGKPVVLCVNKCDNIGEVGSEFYEFYNLGLGDPLQISSVHGHGTGDLLDIVFERFPEALEEEEDNEITNVAVIGKPNVGKSSLINYIAKEERSIVSDVAGTTRDSIDTKIENSLGKYNFIDTAGIRRKSKITENVEKYSVLRAKTAVENSDVCVIMIDAIEGITEQDAKIAGIAHESGKGCIIFVNKWDAIEKDTHTIFEYQKNIHKTLEFMPYVPVMFASVKTGQRVETLFKTINKVANSNAMRISTGTLNDLLAQMTTRVPPPTHKGKRLKIYYMTQASTKPPTFVFFCNKAELFHFSYKRYLENGLRETFGFEGTPIRFIIREKMGTAPTFQKQ